MKTVVWEGVPLDVESTATSAVCFGPWEESEPGMICVTEVNDDGCS